MSNIINELSHMKRKNPFENSSNLFLFENDEKSKHIFNCKLIL